nr:hypothetical protein [Tanacetum cinerariifolium]
LRRDAPAHRLLHLQKRPPADPGVLRHRDRAARRPERWPWHRPRGARSAAGRQVWPDLLPAEQLFVGQVEIDVSVLHHQ